MIEKVIQVFDLDFSDINASGETRVFTISGSNNSEFKLEIKNEDNHYYNFVTNSFQVAQSSLEAKADMKLLKKNATNFDNAFKAYAERTQLGENAAAEEFYFQHKRWQKIMLG